MKRYLAAVAMLVIFLAVFTPFASSSPDGLEKVASSLGVEQPHSVWGGFADGYSVSVLGDSYASTLTAGVLGIVFVLGATLLLGAAFTRRNLA